jgi:hypothetical protein
MDEKMSNENLIQIVDSPTWSRSVNGVLRESLIDHIYVADLASITKPYSIRPLFGDHLLLICCVENDTGRGSCSIRRSWKNYSKTALCRLLANEDWSCESDTVQGTWNVFENKLVRIIDTIVPEMSFFNSEIVQKIAPEIKSKINKRKKITT